MSNSNEPLIDAVRNWVHFDNLCIMLSKQINTARNLRNSFETKVLSLLDNIKRLRIKGAILEPSVRKTSVTLSLTNLEESLHKYFTSKKKPDETAAIMEYLREHRGVKSAPYLKKTSLIEEDGAITNGSTS